MAWLSIYEKLAEDALVPHLAQLRHLQADQSNEGIIGAGRALGVDVLRA